MKSSRTLRIEAEIWGDTQIESSAIDARVVNTRDVPLVEQNAKAYSVSSIGKITLCPLRGDIRKNWNDTEKISMAPAQG